MTVSDSLQVTWQHNGREMEGVGVGGGWHLGSGLCKLSAPSQGGSSIEDPLMVSGAARENH